MDQPPNVLFYSKYCQHCKKFAEILFKLPQINDKFIKISVDVKNQRLPSFVQTVPTIVVFEGGQKHILTDSKAFAWINQYLEESSKIELVPYDMGVMSSSLSDGFSFIGDEAGKEAERTFAWVDKLENTRIGLIADNDATGLNSSKSMKLDDSQIERYKQERDRGVPVIQRPQENIDFTKGYDQDQSKVGVDRSVIEQLQNFRGNQIRRGAVPKNAPNFQSTGFNASWGSQSQRGGTVTGFGGQINRQQMSLKQQELENQIERMKSQREAENSSMRARQQGEYMPLNLGRPMPPQSQSQPQYRPRIV